MKTRITLSFLISVLASSTAFSSPGGDGTTDAEANTEHSLVRVEMLQADMESRTTNIKELAFRRSVQLDESGFYAVRIVSAGMMEVVRMEGTYLDSALTIAHGNFNYYHVNGRIESRGEYRNGIKYGTWYRAKITGEVLAERMYTGHTIEQVLLHADQISYATTLTAPRKWCEAVEF